MILKCRENIMGALNRWHRRKKHAACLQMGSYTTIEKKNGKMMIPENPKIATNPESHLQSQGIPETNNLLVYQFINVAMEEFLENAPFSYR